MTCWTGKAESPRAVEACSTSKWKRYPGCCREVNKKMTYTNVIAKNEREVVSAAFKSTLTSRNAKGLKYSSGRGYQSKENVVDKKMAAVVARSASIERRN